MPESERGFIVLMDQPQNEDGMPLVLSSRVTINDALAAAGAILGPVLETEPELGELSVRTLVSRVDSSVCVDCPHRLECESGNDAGEGEEHLN